MNLMHLLGIFPALRARTSTKLAAIALVCCSTAPAMAQTFVSFGDTIDDPGVYLLAGNQSGPGDGIVIESDDVVLLLGRFTLRGDGTGTGIGSSGYDRVAILGGRVTHFQYGIQLSDAEYCAVKDIRLDDCGGGGLLLYDVEYSSFNRMRCDHNESDGVFVVNSYENRFISILAHDNDGTGIQLVNQATGDSKEYNNRVRQCWAAYNGGDGIRVLDSRLNVITQNECVGNGRAGINLAANATTEDLGFGVSLDTDVNRNWCVFNAIGILVGENATGNTLHDNIALANSQRDLVDETDEPPCQNTWYLNLFLSRGGDGEDCIF